MTQGDITLRKIHRSTNFHRETEDIDLNYLSLTRSNRYITELRTNVSRAESANTVER